MKKNEFGIDKVFYSDEFFLDLFGVPPISKAINECTRIFRVFYLPSFHPETCITICVASGRCDITLLTFQTNIWSFQSFHWMKAKGKWPAESLPPSKPKLWTESQQVSSSRIEGFISRIDSALLISDNDSGIVLDGMSAYWEYNDVSGQCYSYRDQISGNSAPKKFAYEVYRIASESLKGENSIRILENIHGYFGLGLPIKDLGGNPHCIRIFGSLRSGHEDELTHLFDKFPKSKPLLMDLSNLDNMGALLYPTFQHFIKQRNNVPTTWWVSSDGRRHLEAIGISSATIFDNREDAVTALNC